MKFRILLLVLCAFTASCARAPLSPENSLRPASLPSELRKALSDDLSLSQWAQSLERQIEYFAKNPGLKTLRFGSQQIPTQQYQLGLKRLRELALAPGVTAESYWQQVQKEFDFFEVYGRSREGDWGEVFITSYYELEADGARSPTGRFTQAVYMTPEDLVTIDLPAFAASPTLSLPDNKAGLEKKLRGRITPERTVVPYHSREDIDSKGALKSRKLELCYLDPMDAFYLHIQGSGLIRLPEESQTIKVGKGRKARTVSKVIQPAETLLLNYDNQNGHQYQALGSFLKNRIKGDINLQSIEEAMRSMSPQEMQSYLNRNPSYVFFRKGTERALTFIGVPASDGRTIATDRRYFPKGAAGLLVFNHPKTQAPIMRLVLDQDVGGAINGGGRVDLFWGRGEEAKGLAGIMKNTGKLYYLTPKNLP